MSSKRRFINVQADKDSTVQTPPNSNFPTPRPPRDNDEWIALLVALGILGGTAGWLLFGGLPFWRLGDRTVSLLDRRLAGDAQLTDAAEGGDATGEAEEGLSGSSTQGLSSPNPKIRGRVSTTADDNAAITPPAAVDEGSQSERLELTPPGSIPPLRQVEQPVPNSPAQSTPPGSSTASNEPVTVPDPKIPDDVSADDLPIVREPLSFTDVPEGHWAKPYIDVLTAREVLNGLPDGSFAPDRPMTRSELAVQVANAFDMETKADAPAFTDISEDYWAAATIDEAVTTGFMKGYPGNIFRPEQTVPRVQVLVTLATGLSLGEVTSPETVLQAYQDTAAVPAWATGKVASTIASDILAASPDGNAQLRPEDAATRAEVAVMLHRALVYLGQVEPIE